MLARVLRVAAVSLALGGAGFAALAQTGTTPPADAGIGAGKGQVVMEASR